MICVKCRQNKVSQVRPSGLFWCQICLTAVHVLDSDPQPVQQTPEVREHREPQQFPFTDIFTAEKTDIF